jgi:hypothetical protein
LVVIPRNPGFLEQSNYTRTSINTKEYQVYFVSKKNYSEYSLELPTNLGIRMRLLASPDTVINHLPGPKEDE